MVRLALTKQMILLCYLENWLYCLWLCWGRIYCCKRLFCYWNLIKGTYWMELIYKLSWLLPLVCLSMLLSCSCLIRRYNRISSMILYNWLRLLVRVLIFKLWMISWDALLYKRIHSITFSTLLLGRLFKSCSMKLKIKSKIFNN